MQGQEQHAQAETFPLQANELQPEAEDSMPPILGPLKPQLPGQPSISDLFEASYRQTFGHSPPQSPKGHRRAFSDLGAARGVGHTTPADGCEGFLGGSHSSSHSPHRSQEDLLQV